MNLLEKAIIFATEKHQGQVDKLGESYILHPIRVMCDCNSMVEKVVAMLHDVVEDTDATLEDIRNLCGGETIADTIVDAVDAITKKDGVPYEKYIENIKNNPVARTVKIADIRDNLSPIRQYRLPHDKQAQLKAKYIKALAMLQ